MRNFITDDEMNLLEKTGDVTVYRPPQSFTTGPTAPQSALPGVADSISQFGTGAAKGLLSTAYGAAKLGQDIGNVITRPLGLKDTNVVPQQKPSFLEPQGTAQNVGFMVEQIAEFLLPASKVAKVSTAINKASTATKLPGIVRKGISLAGRSALEAGAAGGQRLVQTGGDTNEAKTAALVGGAFPIIGAALGAVGRAVGATGKKIQQTVIRPNARDFADGFKMDNVFKYDVGGSLSEVVTKSHVKMNQLSQELSRKLANADNALNLNRVLDNTRKALVKNRSLDFGENVAINRVLKQVNGEITEVAGKNGLVDLVEANMIKRGAGTKGAWAFGRVDPDAGAIEKVYSAFYHEMRLAIEKVAPPGVREINKQISELIPISNAALRRLPVEQRNNVLGLTDSIGLFASVFDPRALALIGAQKLSRSGRFGNFLVGVAQKFKPQSEIAKRFLP